MVAYLRTYIVIGVASMLTLGSVTFMAFDNQAPYVYISGHVVPDPAAPGLQVQVNWHLIKHRTCPGYIQRAIVDGNGEYRYDPVPASGNVASNFWVTFALPAAISSGKYRYRVYGTYWCNPVQWFWPIKTTTPDIPFEVLWKTE